MGEFSNALRRRLTQRPPASLPAGEVQLALPDGRKLWATAVPAEAWPQLRPGQLLLIQPSSRRHLPVLASLQPCKVVENKLAHPAAPSIVLLWGWHAPDAPDTRCATILRRHELAAVLRYEIRETSCPDVVATLLPPLN